MFYISYFANIKNIPKGVEVVGIVNSMPRWLEGKGIRNITDLAPTGQILRLWKSGTISWDEYCFMYYRDVISQLNFDDILGQLGSEDVCMCCYERNGEHCHRYLVKRWFELHGVSVTEI